MFFNYFKYLIPVILLVVVWLFLSMLLTWFSPNMIFQNKLSQHSSQESGFKQEFVKGEYGKIGVKIYDSEIKDKYIIYAHGNAGRLQNFYPNLTKVGIVYSPAYNGYHESEGEATMEGSYDSILKTYDYMVKEKGIEESKIVILGHSLGGSVATYLASQKPKASKLVLINTFSSVQSMCYRNYSILCVFGKNIFNSAENAKKVTIPVREFAYTKDQTVPYDEGKKLFEYFTESKDKQFFTQEKYTHTYPDWDIILKEI
jgi:pimeloyl-ACP methyl ester carboxylesterase